VIRILFDSHCPSANTVSLRNAALAGIEGLNLDGVSVTAKSPLETDARDVEDCDGILIGTTENFGNMAGLSKDFFERIYNPCLESRQGLPVALYIRAGEDGRGAQSSIEKILTGLRWKPISESLILRGAYNDAFEVQVAELAMTMAAGLDADIF
jgi:multimeric flavodoxin WrbA